MSLETIVHTNAVVHPTAELEPGVVVDAYAYIGPSVKIAYGTRVHTHAMILENVVIGKNCEIYPGAVIGAPPQDIKYKGEKTFVVIGDNTIIREFVTIHRAIGDGVTEIGSNCFLMAYCHIGHNCKIGNYVTMANMVGISGHVVVEDRVTFGGIVGVHQFVRIGKLAMVGGYSKVVKDVPPFMIVDGRPAEVVGINVVGLRRAGIPPTIRSELKKAYKLLFRSKLNLAQAIEAIEKEVAHSPEVEYLLEFMKEVRWSYAGRQLDPHARKKPR